jgi:hypothetical protein
MVEGNHLVGKVIQALILYGQAENCLGDEPGLTELTDDCWKITALLDDSCCLPIAAGDGGSSSHTCPRLNSAQARNDFKPAQTRPPPPFRYLRTS